MFFSYNAFNEWERPDVILCEISKKRLGVLTALNLTMDIRYTNISQVNFTVPSISDEVGYVYDEVRELRMVEIPNFGWFQIREVNEVSDGIRLVKECIAYSAECILQNKQVINLEGDYKLWDPLRPNETLLGILLLKVPGWKIGRFDGNLLTRYRSLNISKQNLYALLTNDISKAYECIFVFDYQRYEINVIDISLNQPETSIYLSYDNLIKNSTVKPLTDNIITVLSVKGGNIDIAGVNPNGSDKLYNIDYYKDRMSPELVAAYNAYTNRFNTLQPQFANLMSQYKLRQQELALLQATPPQYDVSFTSTQDGTARVTPSISATSGLFQLEALERNLENIRAVRIEKGNIPYTDVNAIMTTVKSQITSKKSAITAKEAQITTLNNQLAAITTQLKMENNFTEAQWIELNQYFYEDYFVDDTFITTDLMSQEEKQNIQQELYDYGVRALTRSAAPRFTFEIDSINFLALPEFKVFTDEFRLGSTFTLDLGNMLVKPLLLEVHINFDDPTDFKLTYSNRTMLDGGFLLEDYEGSNVSLSNTISFDLVKIESLVRQSDYVTELINGVLDTSRNELISSPDETRVTIDESGLRTYGVDADTHQDTGYGIWMTGSQIAMSDNFFSSVKLAAGRIRIPSGGYVYGIAGDLLAGRILAGNNLHITNSTNSFKLDETGAWLNNANFTITKTQGGITNKIVLDPLEGFSIYKGNERQAYIDANGNLILLGNIRGGSIDINGQFLVDEQGNVTIKRGSIDINNGNFYVDSSGNVTIKRGSIAIGGSAGSPNFSVDANGNLYARNANITGIINATGGNFSGSINVGNGNFIVDSFGNMTARNATITGGSITLGNTTITGSQLRAIGAYLDATSLYLGPVRGTQIPAGDITAGHIAANSISADKIQAGAITADKIGAGQITADKIAAGAITVGMLNVDRLSAISANMGTITAGEIRGGSITSNSVINVTTDLNVGDNIYLGNIASQSRKSITFNQASGISSTGPGISISARDIAFGVLDVYFSGTRTIDCGGATITNANIQGMQATAVWG